MSFLLRLINLVFTLYSFAIIARTLLPWLRVDPYNPVVQFIVQITEPMLAPLRRYVRPAGGLDFTPMIALLILWFIEQLLRMLIVTIG